jgi:hypothetical protein
VGYKEAMPVTRRTATLTIAFALLSPVGMAADSVPIAIQGYDPVAYFTLQRATPGIAKFESKREMVKTAFEGEPGKVPIQLLRNVRGDVVWMIDRAAADGLESTDYQTG